MISMIEFSDYQAANDDQLPSFDPREDAAVDHFLAAMSKIPSLTDLYTIRFGVLSTLAKVLLVLQCRS